MRSVKTEWWDAGVVICLEQGADLHMAQLMPLPITVFCFSKILIGFTVLVPGHPGSPGKRAVKPMCVCVFLRLPIREIKLHISAISKRGSFVQRETKSQFCSQKK